ncbi:o-succinylbenzoate synthase [Nesterenkonia flava]|uniref:o-succinylbenzoate synthase n=1 Tax=Nesterenkonia flava TaxID=469799 RepID=A0ABU1FSR3_9MICC|nr:o-succinylbenzoate synthase [Nesterenkonia flava]MDR5711176.1 o-succinylbenzoate synthase [Nesterenkonia flava]
MSAAALQNRPELQELLESAVVVRLPMLTRFRGHTSREAVLFSGPAGWGEFAPFPEYQPPETQHWLASAIEAAWSGLGAPLRRSLPVNATVPAVPPEKVSEILDRYGDSGTLDAVQAVKIKVAEPGQTLDDDVARVREVARQMPTAGIRVDANGAWSLSEAVTALEQIGAAAEGRLDYAEQPVAGIEPLAQLREALERNGIGVRIAADEAVRKAEDPLRVARLGAADLIVVKVPPLGGVSRALRIVEEAGLPAVVSSALDTSVGLAAGVALAARLPELPYACGLGTVTLFCDDVVPQPMLPVSGRLRVPVNDKGHIAAPVPNPQKLAALRVTGERELWWHQRIREAYSHRIYP